MRIVLDLQTYQAAARHDDIAQSVLSFAKALTRRGQQHDIRLVLNGRFGGTIEAVRAEFGDLISQDCIHVFDVPGPVATRDPANAWRSRAAEQIREDFIANLRPDLVLIPDIFRGLLDEVVTPPNKLDLRYDTAIMLFDIASLAHNHRSAGKVSEAIVRDWHYRKLQTLRSAARTLTISNHDRQQALALLQLPESRAAAITMAADPLFRPQAQIAEDASELKTRLGLSKPFVLIADSAHDAHGIGKLLEAFALLPVTTRSRYQLVVIGDVASAQRESLLGMTRVYGIDESSVIFAGRTTPEDRKRLYGTTELCVCSASASHPDLRILEAFACGTAVVAGNTPYGAELLERADALFDPANAREIAVKIEQALTDPHFAASLRAHGIARSGTFTWEASADRALEMFQRLHARRLQASAAVPSSLPTKRPRLAYFSPLPPARTGIADYSAELLPALAQFYDIELVIAQAAVADAALNANFPIRTVDWFERHATEFDRILYHFGNSEYHLHMFELLRRHPGVVVLHDFFLSGAQFNLEAHGVVPNAVALALYESHGYKGLIDERQSGRAAALWKYPCNKTVLDAATGVIVHSQFSRQLAEQWYGSGAAANWAAIPLPRAMPQARSRSEARTRIGLGEGDFLVCSFGMLGPSKCNARLLDAWLATPLASDPHCHLAFVGENDGGAYGRELLDAIAASEYRDRIKITGFATPEMYQNYLAAADLGVQLRSHSRGETSAAILDCLVHGLPTVANANGAADELPNEVLWKLPDDFAQEDLSTALTALRSEPERAQQLGRRAIAYSHAAHHPSTAAEGYFNAIETFAGNSKAASYRNLIETLASIPSQPAPQQQDLMAAAKCISANRLQKRPRQLLVDVSAIVQLDYKTGIQRVVRSILNVLINNPPEGFRVEPVFSTGGQYMYARRFALDLVDVPDFGVEDAPIEVAPGDMFLGLDLFTHGVTLNHHRFLDMRERGVAVYFVVYDILPILRPDVFSDGTDVYYANWVRTVASVADGLVCISRAVADELTEWLEKNAPTRHTDLAIGYFHLGANIVASVPTSGLASNVENIDRQMRNAPTILMVGTLEPRKGHAQALSAFELLWARNVPVNLVIVGKNGWMVNALVKRLRNHAEAGKHLFWLDEASDEMLLKLYDTSSALLAASEGEGFGLPLIEAAQHKLPIIARDLPVFQEVAEQHAFYFSGNTPEALAAALENWLELQRQEVAPQSTGLRWLTWEESTQQLINVTLNKDWYRHLATRRPDIDRSALHQLLVDVSSIARLDLQTGIERMIRAQLHELMKNPPAGFRVEPVYLSDSGGKWHYRYAHAYKNKFLAGGGASISDAAVTVGAGDIFYAPDYYPGGVVEAARAGLYAEWKRAGVDINFLVHDILPVLRPDFFPPQADVLHARWLDCIADHADRLICVSGAVAEETKIWLQKRRRTGTDPSSLRYNVVHHGADIAASAPSRGMPDTARELLDKIAATPSFLMVGTIEPRKGHLQAVAACEQLWREGHQINLVIVGKEGWTALEPTQRRTIPKIVETLQGHPELGKRLIWLQGISDEYLEQVYAASACLLAPSEGEGFGLPLIEAARHQLPIIARDMPVFREVAQDNATYFSGLAADDLRSAILGWLDLHAQGNAPASAPMAWRTWTQNTEELTAILTDRCGTHSAA